jgi:uridine kinase
MSAGTGAVIGSYARVAAEIRRRPARLGRTRLVAVDGPSGAGKTQFAARLAAAVRAAGATAATVPTDDQLDGWDDQLTFWPRLEAQVLGPLRAGRPAGYHPYDWHAGAFRAERVAVPAADVVILDGVSTARAVIRPELTLAVFVTAPPGTALARALARDGARFEPYLRRWQAVERRHFAAEATAAHADLVVDGAARGRFDPATQFVRVDGVALVGDDRR